MKRVHLFEFEDFAWFPAWLRDCMTRYISAFHGMLGTTPQMAGLVARALEHAAVPRIVDLCSGGGGPMLDVAKLLREKHGVGGLELTLSDLYPNLAEARRIADLGDPAVRYVTEPVDAAAVPEHHRGVRTMVCSLHHMRPEVARRILEDSERMQQPFCAFEISDNAPPIWLWWMAIPFAFVATFFVTPRVRPMTWQQLFFTYAVPIIPLFIAWDGAVSNARTYTESDMRELTEGLGTSSYHWEMGVLPGRGGGKAWLLGLPIAA